MKAKIKPVYNGQQPWKKPTGRDKDQTPDHFSEEGRPAFITQETQSSR